MNQLAFKAYLFMGNKLKIKPSLDLIVLSFFSLRNDRQESWTNNPVSSKSFQLVVEFLVSSGLWALPGRG
jgi:hypothetical protein